MLASPVPYNRSDLDLGGAVVRISSDSDEATEIIMQKKLHGVSSAARNGSWIAVGSVWDDGVLLCPVS
jgi:hypothetical protein